MNNALTIPFKGRIPEKMIVSNVATCCRCWCGFDTDVDKICPHCSGRTDEEVTKFLTQKCEPGERLSWDNI